jgi:type II secretory ATPase GspE/PulE/Tfp pilus assembly ATPase PilB-like protein
MTTESQFQETVDRIYGGMLEGEVKEAVTEAVEEAKEVLDIETAEKIGEEEISKAPVAKVLNAILESAVEQKASDIHIEPQKDYLRVRFRINGILSERLKLPLTLAPQLISRIKILADMKIDVKRKPQDGRFYIKAEGNEIDLRVSTLPIVYGEKVVIRLLKKSGGIMKIEETGLRGSALALYLDAISLTNGIILITGPTGSGKTATLAASISRINTPQVNIITLEDPVEIKIPGVNQVQINPAVGLTFASGLRSILRQDPNIIMVGEIRDEETARLAVQAALTGHLVFSTLHTNDAASALPRLLDMNIESYLITSTVRLIVAQRLVRTLCDACKEPYEAGTEVLADIQMKLTGIKEFNFDEFIRRKGKDGKLILYRPKGCQKCNNTGYSGRTGIFEVLKMSDTIAQMVMQHRVAADIAAEARKEGMISMMQDGYLKALDGITTIEEVLRVTKV